MIFIYLFCLRYFFHFMFHFIIWFGHVYLPFINDFFLITFPFSPFPLIFREATLRSVCRAIVYSDMNVCISIRVYLDIFRNGHIYLLWICIVYLNYAGTNSICLRFQFPLSLTHTHTLSSPLFLTGSQILSRSFLDKIARENSSNQLAHFSDT